jgi:hypothetical protein
VKAALVKAMVLGDMRRAYAPALQVLRQARASIAGMPGVDASRLYVKEAELLADAGDAAGVQQVIAAYKASPYFDPKPYAWSGMSAPGDPLVLTRPGANEADSLPLSIMESALARAAVAPGVAFPEMVLTDVNGRRFTTSSFRGRVVLFDFFARGWRSWEDDREQTGELWRRYHPMGFDVVSVCLERDPTGVDSLALPGWVVPAAPELARSLGVFGDRTTFLLDRDGNVLGRNLRGQDLAFAIRQAMGQ